MPDRLLLVDSASLYFRAFHGVPESMTAPDGTPVNAVRGFLDMLATLVARRRPRRMVACWDDDWRPAFRVAALPSYKAHRLADPKRNIEETPAALEPQVPVIVDVLAALGIARVGGAGLEADDVIGTLATREAAAGPATSTSSPATATSSSWSTTPAASACSTSAGACATSRSSTRRGCTPSTGSVAATATPTWRCCAATRATACPASPASARRRRQP